MTSPTPQNAPCSPPACPPSSSPPAPNATTPETARAPLPCTAPAQDPLPPIVLEESVARFEREAEQGVYDTGRYRMRYYVWGSGPPLVFIHGVGDSSRSFVQPIARLSAHFRCIAYDLPNGHDDGARLWRHGHAGLVADFWALLDHLKLERTYVLGASFGSTVALQALRAQPGRLPRAILQGALAYRPLRRAELVLARMGRFLPGPMARVPYREKMLGKVNEPMFTSRPESVWRAFLDWTGRARIACLAHQVMWLHQLDLRPHLAEVKQPVLLVVGDRDAVVPWRYTEVLMEGLPSAGRALLEGCGHLPAYTHPEAFAEVIRRFLTPQAARDHAACATCPGAASCSEDEGVPEHCPGHAPAGVTPCPSA